jgi:hypothetical protein
VLGTVALDQQYFKNINLNVKPKLIVEIPLDWDKVSARLKIEAIVNLISKQART